MLGLLDGLFNGLSIGAVLLLTALGLSIVFGLMGVINMAHGELMMLGAYTTFLVQLAFKPLGQPLFDAYFWVALPLSFAVAAGAGLLLERSVIRLLYGRPLETLLATWGVSLILQQFVRSISTSFAIGLVTAVVLFLLAQRLLLPRFAAEVRGAWQAAVGVAAAVIGSAAGLALAADSTLARPWFGARNLDVTAPSFLREALSLGELRLPYARIFIIILTAIALAVVYWFLQKTPWGLRIRAVTQNRQMSACLGIPTERVDAITFAIGSGLAGVAGCAVTLLGSVGPNLGTNYIVDAFMVVVIGGVGKLVGSIVAALVLGLLNYIVGSGTLLLLLGDSQSGFTKVLFDVFTFFATTSMAKVLVFALIILFLQVRPAGLFPQKGRTVEN